MLKLSIAFILVTLMLGTEGSRCNSFGPLIYNPVCGIAKDCVYHADNDFVARFQDCRRRELGIPPFLSIEKNECPSDKPRCPPVN
nr:accessory gland protein Acp63F-like [Drosophila takahashii]